MHNAKHVVGKGCTANLRNARPAQLCPERATWVIGCVPAGYFCTRHAVQVSDEHRDKGCTAVARE
jgi:hypothetical protein